MQHKKVDIAENEMRQAKRSGGEGVRSKITRK